MEEKDNINKAHARNIPYTGQLNKHSFAQSTDTIRQRKKGMGVICKCKKQTQNQETLVP